MPRWISDTIEFAVGLACLAIAWASWPRRGAFRLVAVLMALAGSAAIGNVVRSLLNG